MPFGYKDSRGETDDGDGALPDNLGAKSMNDAPDRCTVTMWVPRRWLALGLVVLALALATAAQPAARPVTLVASAPTAAVNLTVDRSFVGKGDGLNFSLWLNVTGNGQIPTTWVNVTFSTAPDPNDNGLVQGPGAWTQPSGCTTLLAWGWLLRWQCDGLHAGSYPWRIPATAASNATVGRYQTVVASAASASGTGIAETSANASVWIAGAIVRITSVDSDPTESTRGGQIVAYWVNASNDAPLDVPPDANGTATAYRVTIGIELDPGLRPGQGLVNLTTTFAKVPPGTQLSVSILAIVADNLTAGTAVGIRVRLSYDDFNGHAIGPIEAASSPLYVVRASALSPANLIAGAAIGLIFENRSSQIRR